MHYIADYQVSTNFFALCFTLLSKQRNLRREKKKQRKLRCFLSFIVDQKRYVPSQNPLKSGVDC